MEDTARDVRKIISVRFMDSERKHLEEQAHVAGLTLSEYIRRRVLGRPVVANTDIAMIRELRRIGGLLKHVYSSSGGVYAKETADALAAVRDYIRQLSSKDRNRMSGADDDEQESGGRAMVTVSEIADVIVAIGDSIKESRSRQQW